MSISLCMIVKNEEDCIARCLSSVQDMMDEIIIVDTGSTDRTKQLCTQYTTKIYDFEWVDDFAAARNYSFSLANMDYIFWLDADDMLQPEDQLKLHRLKNTLDHSYDSVSMEYQLAFDEYGNVVSSLRRNRLVKRQNGFRWVGPIHEYLEVGGNIFESDVAIIHNPRPHFCDRNLRIYEKRLAAGEIFTPRDIFYYANELKDHKIYDRAIYYYEKFLQTGKGWLEDNISACDRLADCYHEIRDYEQEVAWILRSLLFDRPRAQQCCRLGYYFLEKGQYKAASYWYETAIASRNEYSWGIANHACSTWLPHLQLCVCYDRLGEYERAYEHNEKAREYRPDDEKILHNKKYLESKLSITNDGEISTEEKRG